MGLNYWTKEMVDVVAHMKRLMLGMNWGVWDHEEVYSKQEGKGIVWFFKKILGRNARLSERVRDMKVKSSLEANLLNVGIWDWNSERTPGCYTGLSLKRHLIWKDTFVWYL